MNRPRNAPLLAALVAACLFLGAGATWMLWDWSRNLAAAEGSAPGEP